jgi:hypothetical protein
LGLHLLMILVALGAHLLIAEMIYRFDKVIEMLVKGGIPGFSLGFEIASFIPSPAYRQAGIPPQARGVRAGQIKPIAVPTATLLPC